MSGDADWICASSRRGRSISAPVDVVFRLAPGDRPLVAAGRFGRRRRADRRAAARPAARRADDPRDRHAAPRAPLDRAVRCPRRPGRRRRVRLRLARPLARRRRAISRDPLEMPFAGHRPRRPAGDVDHRPRGRSRASAASSSLGGPTRGRLQAHAGRRAASRVASTSAAPGRSSSWARGWTPRR